MPFSRYNGGGNTGSNRVPATPYTNAKSRQSVHPFSNPSPPAEKSGGGFFDKIGSFFKSAVKGVSNFVHSGIGSTITGFLSKIPVIGSFVSTGVGLLDGANSMLGGDDDDGQQDNGRDAASYGTPYGGSGMSGRAGFSSHPQGQIPQYTSNPQVDLYSGEGSPYQGGRSYYNQNAYLQGAGAFEPPNKQRRMANMTSVGSSVIARQTAYRTPNKVNSLSSNETPSGRSAYFNQMPSPFQSNPMIMSTNSRYSGEDDGYGGGGDDDDDD